MLINLFGENTNTEYVVNKDGIITPRYSTFEDIGTNVNALTIEDALNQGGLNYEVHQEPIFLENNISIPNRYATVRNDGYVYDIVSNRYNIIQNREAFSFIDVMKDNDLEIKKVGETKAGMIYIICALPKINILDDDYQPYVIFRNSHNGRYQLQATICPLRIVCQNQFNIAFKESPNTITIRHTPTYKTRLEDANRVLAGTADYLIELNKQAEQYSKIGISDIQLGSIIDSLFEEKEDMKDFQKQRLEENRSLLLKAYNADDNQNFKGSMWGLINAYSDYITHRTPQRKTDTAEENKFVAVTFDPTIMSQFIQLVNSKIAA